MKFIYAVMALVMAFSFVGCGNDSNEPVDTVTVTAEPETVTPEPETVAPEPEYTEPPEQSMEELFLEYLRAESNWFDNVPDATILDTVDAMCGAWDRGASFEDVILVLQESGIPDNAAAVFIGAGTEAFCPEHSDNFATGSAV